MSEQSAENDALPCCNYREDLDRPCDGMALYGWPTYVCDTCGGRCGTVAHQSHVIPPVKGAGHDD